jgi:acyl carrier protein
MSDMETELKNLIVTHLMLEDVTAAEIDSDAPIFGDGLGLDSIDALELALAINKVYGVKIKADDERNAAIFRSVRTLAAFISENRQPEGAR